MDRTRKAALLFAAGAGIVVWFTFELPPLAAPLVSTSSGGSLEAPGESATVIALPYLAFILVGLGLALYAWLLWRADPSCL